MKSVLPLTLIICLAGAVPSGAAPERFDAADAPIARAVTTEASRLAATQPTPSSYRDWSRLRALQPLTDIIVTVTGSGPVRWSFVRADESALWVKTYDRDRSPMPIGRVDVVEVRQAATIGHPGRGALIGLAVGSVIPIIYAANCHAPDCSMGVGLTFILSGGIGAGLGTLIGEAAHKTEETIYRSETR